ncbi:MAG: carbohydrate ABC transporter permease [Clostridia bacterium]|nr:carbohydrate ABC transporter permease [Clostridia bacterium]
MSSHKAIRDTRSDRVLQAVSYILVIVFTLICLYPLVYVLSMSFSSDSAVMSNSVWLLPKGLSVNSYKTALGDANLINAVKNSVVYTLLATAISVFLTVTFGYALSRKNTWFNAFLQRFAMVCMIFSGGMIPTFIWITKLGLYDSMWAFILSGTLSIWNAILVRVFVRNNIPESLYEAAYIDGANELQQFVLIVLPLSTTIIAIISLYAVVQYWNSYLEALLYLANRKKWPLQVYLRNLLEDVTGTWDVSSQGDEMMQYLANQNRIKYVSIVLSTLPVVVFYPFLQKFFVKGVMIGGIKE